MAIKKGDFVEVEYTARLKSTNKVFDTTEEKIAKENDFPEGNTTYGPMIIAAGEGHLMKGVDEFIIDKEPGTYKIDLEAEKAFGKKNAKLLRLISRGEFHKHKIDPIPGLEVELDGNRGIVRTVNGGRVIVDFNHPLASQDVTYDMNIKRIITDDKEKVSGLLKVYKIPFQNVEMKDNSVEITFGMEVPAEIKKPIADEIVRLTKIKDIVFK
jgi:FKBP-type peptidyl-prolyl cis-trans isomerase SlyD